MRLSAKTAWNRIWLVQAALALLVYLFSTSDTPAAGLYSGAVTLETGDLTAGGELESSYGYHSRTSPIDRSDSTANPPISAAADNAEPITHAMAFATATEITDLTAAAADDYEVEMTPVPEPATYLAAALAGLVAAARVAKHRRKAPVS